MPIMLEETVSHKSQREMTMAIFLYDNLYSFCETWREHITVAMEGSMILSWWSWQIF